MMMTSLFIRCSAFIVAVFFLFTAAVVDAGCTLSDTANMYLKSDKWAVASPSSAGNALRFKPYSFTAKSAGDYVFYATSTVSTSQANSLVAVQTSTGTIARTTNLQKPIAGLAYDNSRSLLYGISEGTSPTIYIWKWTGSSFSQQEAISVSAYNNKGSAIAVCVAVDTTVQLGFVVTDANPPQLIYYAAGEISVPILGKQSKVYKKSYQVPGISAKATAAIMAGGKEWLMISTEEPKLYKCSLVMTSLLTSGSLSLDCSNKVSLAFTVAWIIENGNYLYLWSGPSSVEYGNVGRVTWSTSSFSSQTVRSSTVETDTACHPQLPPGSVTLTGGIDTTKSMIFALSSDGYVFHFQLSTFRLLSKHKLAELVAESSGLSTGDKDAALPATVHGLSVAVANSKAFLGIGDTSVKTGLLVMARGLAPPTTAAAAETTTSTVTSSTTTMTTTTTIAETTTTTAAPETSTTTTSSSTSTSLATSTTSTETTTELPEISTTASATTEEPTTTTTASPKTTSAAAPTTTTVEKAPEPTTSASSPATTATSSSTTTTTTKAPPTTTLKETTTASPAPRARTHTVSGAAPPPPAPDPIPGAMSAAEAATASTSSSVIAAAAGAMGGAPAAALQAGRIIAVPQIATCTGRSADDKYWIKQVINFPQSFVPGISWGDGSGGFIRTAIMSVFAVVIILAIIAVILLVLWSQSHQVAQDKEESRSERHERLATERRRKRAMGNHNTNAAMAAAAMQDQEDGGEESDDAAEEDGSNKTEAVSASSRFFGPEGRILFARFVVFVVAQVLASVSELGGLLLGGENISDVDFLLGVAPVACLLAFTAAGFYTVYRAVTPRQITKGAAPIASMAFVPSVVEFAPGEAASRDSSTGLIAFFRSRIGRQFIGHSCWLNPNKTALAFAILRRFQGKPEDEEDTVSALVSNMMVQQQQQQKSCDDPARNKIVDGTILNNDDPALKLAAEQARRRRREQREKMLSLRQKLRNTFCCYTLPFYMVSSIVCALLIGIAKNGGSVCHAMLWLVALINLSNLVWDIVLYPVIVVPVRCYVSFFMNFCAALLSLIAAAALGSEEAARQKPGVVLFISKTSFITAIVGVSALVLFGGCTRVILLCSKIEIMPETGAKQRHQSLADLAAEAEKEKKQREEMQEQALKPQTKKEKQKNKKKKKKKQQLMDSNQEADPDIDDEMSLLPPSRRPPRLTAGRSHQRFTVAENEAALLEEHLLTPRRSPLPPARGNSFSRSPRGGARRSEDDNDDVGYYGPRRQPQQRSSPNRPPSTGVAIEVPPSYTGRNRSDRPRGYIPPDEESQPRSPPQPGQRRPPPSSNRGGRHAANHPPLPPPVHRSSERRPPQPSSAVRYDALLDDSDTDDDLLGYGNNNSFPPPRQRHHHHHQPHQHQHQHQQQRGIRPTTPPAPANRVPRDGGGGGRWRQEHSWNDLLEDESDRSSL